MFFFYSRGIYFLNIVKKLKNILLFVDYKVVKKLKSVLLFVDYIKFGPQSFYFHIFLNLFLNFFEFYLLEFNLI